MFRQRVNVNFITNGKTVCEHSWTRQKQAASSLSLSLCKHTFVFFFFLILQFESEQKKSILWNLNSPPFFPGTAKVSRFFRFPSPVH